MTRILAAVVGEMGRDREQTGSNQGTWATEDPLQELGTMAEEDH